MRSCCRVSRRTWSARCRSCPPWRAWQPMGFASRWPCRSGGEERLGCSLCEASAELYVRPENAKIERDGIERFGPNACVAFVHADDEPARSLLAEDLEGSFEWVDQPRMRDVGPAV